jgi:3-methyladenine DNA glycosylase AlkD
MSTGKPSDETPIGAGQMPDDLVAGLPGGLGNALAASIAADMAREIEALPRRNIPSVRAVRRVWSHRLAQADPLLVRAVADALLDNHGLRWCAYELVAFHPAAFAGLTQGDVVALGRAMASWSHVDTFGRTLSGPAWVHGQLSDAEIARWAASPDRWWRRAALVSTVALNERALGPAGDPSRTLAVCRVLLADRDDMVVKGLSWALRSLAERDPAAVREFLRETEGLLAPRARRETVHKLETGLKSPRRGVRQAAVERA